ncbi:uncharacterized protein LOC124706595 [Lolium rigidum]|uniref:uncharacterized protein LOC124706595 n=1 Tax=Lolium rigidum TaxID=89674 RepID=UPI001F5D5BA9|nr:uncharacterized protein LOC124706595 [Lolium rigidum]
MDLLEQPLEAVAFRIYSLPEVAAAGAAAWTCLAAVLAAAAAAGVWRLRSSSTADFTDDTKPLQLDTSKPPISASETKRSAERPTEPTTSSPAPSPKERYTAYYQDSGRVGYCGVESDDEEDEEKLDPQDYDGVYGPWEKKDPFEWEVVRSLVPVVATATTDVIGRYRSPRAVSGTVVRLWDQGADHWGLTAAIPRRGVIRAGTASSF